MHFLVSLSDSIRAIALHSFQLHATGLCPARSTCQRLERLPSHVALDLLPRSQISRTALESTPRRCAMRRASIVHQNFGGKPPRRLEFGFDPTVPSRVNHPTWVNSGWGGACGKRCKPRGAGALGHEDGRMKWCRHIAWMDGKWAIREGSGHVPFPCGKRPIRPS